VLAGGGSSDLIFLALRHWLRRHARVLILDPMYGEYAHLLEQVIRCRVDRLPLRREDNYGLDPARLSAALQKGYDLVVLVNPNSPTGRHVPRAALEECLRDAPVKTRIWLDETYVDYLGAGESLEKFASQSPNLTVCKSMSKVYALSGLRAAYLVAAPQVLEELRAITPPWAVSLPAQVAGVHALRDSGYYAARWAETHRLRQELFGGLRSLKMEVVPGQANFLLAHLPAEGADAETLITRCHARGLFLRNAANMSNHFGDHTIRIAVKDAATTQRMLQIMREEMNHFSQL
jgi:histidinol-phosphate/aromatic aminotransferase/cobyric acid decarboxylase-like protein